MVLYFQNFFVYPDAYWNWSIFCQDHQNVFQECYHNREIKVASINRYQQYIRQNTITNKNRKRNMIWFNPPYSANVVTKVGKHFLSLLDKHFHNKFHQIFNRNTVKISYSLLPNMKTIINSHNHKITNPKTITQDRTCNYVDKAKCPKLPR